MGADFYRYDDQVSILMRRRVDRSLYQEGYYDEILSSLQLIIFRVRLTAGVARAFAGPHLPRLPANNLSKLSLHQEFPSALRSPCPHLTMQIPLIKPSGETA